MIIRKIKLRNIKSYYGEHILELPRPTHGRNLHLLGAHNGNGKTTLFESVDACLFATRDNPILTASHLSRGIPAQDMEVEIEFEHDGQLYLLNRIWVVNPREPETSSRSTTLNSFLENRETKESFRSGDDEETITAFVNYLVPRQISHFFLFDGEQIQEYTDASAESVRDAIERLLGLHHYIQLLQDVRQEIEPSLRRARNALNIREDHTEKLNARDSTETDLKANSRRICQIKKSINETRGSLEELERSISRIEPVFDEDFKSKRRELEGRRSRLQLDIESADGELKKLISNDLVITLFWQEIQRAYSEFSNGRLPNNSSELFELEGLVRFLWGHRHDVISALSEESPESLQTMLTPVTENQIEAALYDEGVQLLAQIIEGSSGKLWTILDRVTDLNAELNRTDHELSALPSPDSMDVDMRSFQQEFADNQRILVRHESSLDDLLNEGKRLQQELDKINDDLRRLGQRNEEFRRIDAQWTISVSVQKVLERFIDDYRSSRIRELEDTLNRKFHELTNSPETVDRIEIDRNTFDINTILRSEANLAASEGSAGQKEVLAFSLIASVVELSNKQLPMIIDTPLARLDTVHRDNILSNFFPNVGEQVIILSTDAEVGFEQYNKLSRYLASEHHLRRESGQTSINEGYLVQ